MTQMLVQCQGQLRGHYACSVFVTGQGPSARYAHTLALVANRFIVAMGGNDGRNTLADAWSLDTSEKPYQWRKVSAQGINPPARCVLTCCHLQRFQSDLYMPCRIWIKVHAQRSLRTALLWSGACCTHLQSQVLPVERHARLTASSASCRMYATAAARQDGLLLLCGGRSSDGKPLEDAYGLARHRDGRWEWASAPSQMPVGRYQHAAVFVGARLHVSGGSLGGGKMVDKKDSILILDSTAGMWATPVREGSDDLSRRCRHAVAAVGPFIFLYGGLVGSTLHSDLLLADDGVMKDTATYDARSGPWLKWLESTNQAASMLAQNAAEEAKAAGSIMMHRASMDTPDGGSGDDLAVEAEAAQREAAQRQLSAGSEGASGENEEGEQQVRAVLLVYVCCFIVLVCLICTSARQIQSMCWHVCRNGIRGFRVAMSRTTSGPQ